MLHPQCTLRAKNRKLVDASRNKYGLIGKLKSQAKSYDVRDEKLTGFILHVQLTGGMFYRCEHARGKRISLGSTALLTPAQSRDKVR